MFSNELRTSQFSVIAQCEQKVIQLIRNNNESSPFMRRRREQSMFCPHNPLYQEVATPQFLSLSNIATFLSLLLTSLQVRLASSAQITVLLRVLEQMCFWKFKLSRTIRWLTVYFVAGVVQRTYLLVVALMALRSGEPCFVHLFSADIRGGRGGYRRIPFGWVKIDAYRLLQWRRVSALLGD